MTPEDDPLDTIAAERGRRLGEIGVRPEDEKWIREEAETLASLAAPVRSRSAFSRFLYRWARKAARTAR